MPWSFSRSTSSSRVRVECPTVKSRVSLGALGVSPLDVLVHGAKKIHVDALLLAQDAQRAKLPPLVWREVGRDLRLAAGLGEPLDQMQVVRLQQPHRDVDQMRALGQPGFVVDVMHQPKDPLLRLVAQEEIHPTVTGPAAAIFWQR